MSVVLDLKLICEKLKIMAAKKLEELTIEQLKKRYKFVTAFFLVLLVTFLILASLNLVLLYLKHTNVSASLFAGLVVLLPIAVGRNKIREELKKRENAA